MEIHCFIDGYPLYSLLLVYSCVICTKIDSKPNTRTSTQRSMMDNIIHITFVSVCILYDTYCKRAHVLLAHLLVLAIEA